jgi:hypothetical protein
MNTYIIEGGIGKQVAFTSIIDALVKKDKEKIQVYSPYVDIFGGNTNIRFALDANTIPVHDKRILDSQNICFCEPYKANFLKGDHHIIQSYCKLFGVKYDESMRPKMYTDHYKDPAKKITGDDDFIVIQFSGGQAPAGFNAQNPYVSNDPTRNYNPFLAQKVIDLIKGKRENLKIINFGLPNEPNYKETEKPKLMPFAQWHEILKLPNCKGFISTDSCLSHFARSAGRKGVAIWGGTRWTQFGYKQNRNINKWWSEWDEWDNEKFEPQDPRNIMVEPKVVFEQFEHIYGKELIK